MVREQRPEDAVAVRKLLTQAFADKGQVADLAQALDARPDRPGVALVAEMDGTPVGHVQLSRGWVDATRRLTEVLILSPLAVTPAHQRRGIGQTLCRAAVDRAAELGIPAVFLEGDPGYYSRLSWERASARGFIAPSKRIPDAGFQVVLLPTWQDWMIGSVVYNDTFWTLDLVGLRDR